MRNEQFCKIIQEEVEICKNLLVAKNHDYAANPDIDAFGNFRDQARRVGLSKEQVWLVHFDKHVIALENWVRKGELRAEAVDVRLRDIINYCLIQLAMLKEGNEERRKHGDKDSPKLEKAQKAPEL